VAKAAKSKRSGFRIVIPIACFFIAIIGITVLLGETGNLPEKAKQWYDKTSQEIRKMFGIEEASEGAGTESKKFTGLEIEGLNHVWQNNRWEYVDPNDSSVAGFWNEKEGKYEHTADVLKGEWKGLFVSQSLEEVRSELKEDKEWTAENWDNGEIKIPLTFDPTKGGIVEKIKALTGIIVAKKPYFIMGFRDLPSETIIFLPFSPDDGQALYGFEPLEAGGIRNPDITLIKEGFHLFFNFKNTEQCLITNNDFPDNSNNTQDNSEAPFQRLVLGSPFLEVGENEEIDKSLLDRINPFLKNNYQVIMSINYEGEKNNLGFSFNNLLRDEKGRFVYINPSEIEREEMKKNIEEEMERETVEAEKQTLEEKFETSSLIEKSETAPVIDGLEFDTETGFYFARENNVYGLTKDTKAGVFRNGLLGLSPEVIKFLQQQEESLKIPLPFNPEEIDDLKMAEEESGPYALIIRLSGDATVFSPIIGLCYDSWGERLWGTQKGSYQALSFDLEGKTVLTISSKEIKYYPHKEKVVIGDKLGEVKQDVLIELEFCELLKIGNNPVFIMINE